MSQIYQQAKFVLGWIGEADTRVIRGLYLVQEMISEARACSDDKEDNLPNVAKLYAIDESLGDEAYEAIERLFQNDYWARIWCFLERGHARGFGLMCGEHMIVVDITPKVVGKLLDWGQLGSYAALEPRFRRNAAACASSIFGKLAMPKESNNLSHPLVTVFSAWKLQSTDPRDKVFALCGFADIKVEIDYAKPVRQVYIDFARRCLENEGLLTLACAGTCLCGGHTEGLQLPSWVPNWLHSSCARLGPVFLFGLKYRAFPLQSPVTFEITDKNELRVGGVDADVISWTRPAKDFSVSDLSNWESMCELLAEKNVINSEWIEDLILTLSVGTKQDVHDKGNFDRLEMQKDGPLFKEIVMETLFVAIMRVSLLDSTGEEEEPNLTFETLKRFVKTPFGWCLSIKVILMSNASFQGGFGKMFLSKLFPREREDLTDLALLVKEVIVSNGPPTDTPGVDDFMRQVSEIDDHRNIFITGRGKIGIGPLMREGDDLCFLEGANMPVIMRKAGDQYVLAGGCYVAGMMDGEILHELEKGTVSKTTFEIC